MTNKQYYGLLGRIGTLEKAHESLKGFSMSKLDALEAHLDRAIAKAEAALLFAKTLERLSNEIERHLEEERQTRLDNADVAGSRIQSAIDAADKKTR